MTLSVMHNVALTTPTDSLNLQTILETADVQDQRAGEIASGAGQGQVGLAPRGDPVRTSTALSTRVRTSSLRILCPRREALLAGAAAGLLAATYGVVVPPPANAQRVIQIVQYSAATQSKANAQLAGLEARLTKIQMSGKANKVKDKILAARVAIQDARSSFTSGDGKLATHIATARTIVESAESDLSNFTVGRALLVIGGLAALVLLGLYLLKRKRKEAEDDGKGGAVLERVDALKDRLQARFEQVLKLEEDLKYSLEYAPSDIRRMGVLDRSRDFERAVRDDLDALGLIFPEAGEIADEAKDLAKAGDFRKFETSRGGFDPGHFEQWVRKLKCPTRDLGVDPDTTLECLLEQVEIRVERLASASEALQAGKIPSSYRASDAQEDVFALVDQYDVRLDDALEALEELGQRVEDAIARAPEGVKGERVEEGRTVEEALRHDVQVAFALWSGARTIVDDVKAFAGRDELQMFHTEQGEFDPRLFEEWQVEFQPASTVQRMLEKADTQGLALPARFHVVPDALGDERSDMSLRGMLEEFEARTSRAAEATPEMLEGRIPRAYGAA